LEKGVDKRNSFVGLTCNDGESATVNGMINRVLKSDDLHNMGE